jgi:ribosomal protein S18 acetylase RimI-like enzyme
MSADELAEWLGGQVEAFAAELVAAGEPADVAADRASRVYADSFPDGRPAERHRVDVGLLDGERIGIVWTGPHPRRPDDTSAAWIFDIEVDAGHRGKGYGRELLAAAEAEVRRDGITELSLNVFGDNEVARGLYKSSGYREVAVIMTKSLDGAGDGPPAEG